MTIENRYANSTCGYYRLTKKVAHPRTKFEGKGQLLPDFTYDVYRNPRPPSPTVYYCNVGYPVVHLPWLPELSCPG